MDLKAVNPTPPEPRSSQSKPAKPSSERASDGGGIVPSSIAPEGDAQETSSAGGSVVDRVELTEDLQNRLREFREKLNEEKELKKEELEELRQKIREDSAVSHAKLLLAADGILKGELYYINRQGR